ncbi:DUF1566 domain-containing protein [candidate division CSSED10-310 bacterium]|uniref:DUF1566 domain-containing protein n=1 Tax=candidate division CSSED10-310 bacterium TaxID=2855610 RepID=A0ABV6YXP2_UNCC1
MKIKGCLIYTAVLMLAFFPLSSLRAETSPSHQAGSRLNLYDQSYALLIGNSTYQNWTPLPCVDDCLYQVASLLEEHGYQITLRKNLTKDLFLEVFTTLTSWCSKSINNRFLLYYIGHGFTHINQSGEKEGHLIMVDSPGPESDDGIFKLKNIDFASLVNVASIMKNRHALFIMDSTFSFWPYQVSADLKPVFMSQAVALPVQQFLNAGQDYRVLGSDCRFTKAFIALAQDKALEPLPDSAITGSELALHMKISFIQQGAEQLPQYLAFPATGAGDVVLLTRPQNTSELSDKPPPVTDRYNVQSPGNEDSYSFPLTSILKAMDNLDEETLRVVIRDFEGTIYKTIAQDLLFLLKQRRLAENNTQLEKHSPLILLRKSIIEETWQYTTIIDEESVYAEFVNYFKGDKLADPRVSQARDILESRKTPTGSKTEFKPSEKTTAKFVGNGDGTVTDLSSGLMWAQRDNGQDLTWLEAQEYCQSFSLAGFDDWRLPTIQELEGLFSQHHTQNVKDYGSYTVHITAGIKLESCCLWSSNLYKKSDEVWAYDYNVGKRARSCQNFDFNIRVLPVRDVE